MYGWIKEYDKTRYIQYESAYPGSNISDIIAPMYPPKSWMDEVMADSKDLRPFIMCEYAIGKSNSNGNFKEYWDMVDKYPRFQGGFVWEFQDKALTKELEDGTFVYVYGGAFDEPVVDMTTEACLNGVVLPDLSFKPSAFEIKNCQAPVRIIEEWHPHEDYTYRVRNDYLMLDLSHIRITWELQCDGHIVDMGETRQYHTPAGESEILEFGLDDSKIYGEAFVNFKIVLKEGTDYVEVGHVISTYQLPLRQSIIRKKVSQIIGSRLLTQETEDEIIILGENTEIRFDKNTCFFSKVVLDLEDRLIGGGDNFYRPPTGIDVATKDVKNYAAEWRDEGLHQLLMKV
jgi:beta-galactosidase